MMFGGKSGWFKESARHSMAARGISTTGNKYMKNKYFLQPYKRVDLPGVQYTGKDVVQDWLDKQKEVRKFRKEAKEFQNQKEGTAPERKKELEALRSAASAKRAAAKEELAELSRIVDYYDKEGLLNPDQRKKLLQIDRSKREERLEKEEEARLGAKQKDVLVEAKKELEEKDFLELEDLKTAMAVKEEPPKMGEGRVERERESLAAYRKRLGLGKEGTVEDLLKPRKVGPGTVRGVTESEKAMAKARATSEKVADEFVGAGFDVVDIPETARASRANDPWGE